MATVVTNDDFTNAVSYLIQQGTLTAVGAIFVDAPNRAVYDENDSPPSDITPSTPTLESALDSANTAIAALAAAEIVKSGAKTQAQNIPSWASWTEAQALSWISTNVTDLNSAKTALSAMARMIIALRNEQWPDLEGS